MNDESLNNLERELGRFRAADLPKEIAERLRAEPAEEALTISDRVLATISGLGVLAACMVVAITVWQMSMPAPPKSSAADVAAQQQMMAEYQRLLAMR